MQQFTARCPSGHPDADWYVQEPAAAAQAVRVEHYSVTCRACIAVLRETA